jgi:hypothetical protein
VAERICRAADRVSDGRVVAVLEGGYDLAALGRSVVGVTEVLAGSPGRAPGDEPVGPDGAAILPGARRAIERTLAAHEGQPWAGGGLSAPSEVDR